MRRKGFPLLGPFLGIALVGLVAASAAAQEAPAGEPAAFPRRYLDAESYRTGGNLLHDWPSLSRLVRWSARIEAAQADPEATLTADLVAEFRARVDTLGSEPVPDFLEPVADSVGVTIDEILGHLERAETSLGAPPPTPAEATADGREENRSDRQRTLVTGSTAVTVPAGVEVGASDSLPTADLEERENFFDRLALAMTALDRLVHLTRTAGRPVSEAPAGRSETSSGRGRPPPPAGP